MRIPKADLSILKTGDQKCAVGTELQRGDGSCARLVAFSAGACADCWPEIGPSASPDMRAAAAYVLERRQPDELVVARGSHVFFGLSYYLRQTETPLLAVAQHGRDGMFGMEHLVDNELITFAELAVRRPAALWIVDSATFATIASKNMAAAPASEWSTVTTRSFASDYNFEQPILVSYLRPRSRGGDQ